MPQVKTTTSEVNAAESKTSATAHRCRRFYVGFCFDQRLAQNRLLALDQHETQSRRRGFACISGRSATTSLSIFSSRACSTARTWSGSISANLLRSKRSLSR